MTAVPQGDEFEIVRSALEPDYELLDELGRGGMAVVYRARERQLDRDVAVKVLPFTMAFDADFVERFQREAKTAGQLEHPHIVPIYRVGRSGQVIYFVMKLLRGQSLSERLKERGRLPTPEVRRILTETAAALGYAAKRGVVHRDIKPDNILLDEEGRCTVTDFGIARSMSDQRLTATGMAVGTPRYMSPEQARAKAVDGRSDIYSLGVVAYECLTGVTPFDGEDAFAILLSHINSPVPRPALTSGEEWELYEIIERMLAKRPEDRFQSADELISALTRETASGGSVSGYAAPGSATAYATRAGTRAHGTYDAEGSGPSPSAGLDAALDAGIQLLKEQKPKVQAGLAAGRTMLQAHRPRVHALGNRLVSRAAGTSRRSRAVAIAIVVTSIGTFSGARYAAGHRSRCPAVQPPAAGSAMGARDSASVAPSPAAALTLLVDAVAPQKTNSGLDVYYDVCGLERGATYKAQITVRRNESGLKRLLGGSVAPVTASYDETATGPATRRRRSVDLSGLPPGSYLLDVVVTDAKRRRREKAVTFQVVER